MDHTLKATETMTGGTLQNPRTEWTTTMHCDLKPYPFSEGMEIPRLMPFQELPFNGDGYLAAEVLRLKEAHGLRDAFETGTCLGSSTIWFSANFDRVHTTETNKAFWEIAISRISAIGGRDNCFLLNGFLAAMGDNGALRTSGFIDDISDRTICFLDAHWGPDCPLLNELEAIGWANVKPCILIHDFMVPGTDFGFDKMPDGRPFNLDLIRTHIDAIYGEGGWKHNYPTKVEGARRGWISIEPVQP